MPDETHVDAILCEPRVIQGGDFATRAVWANRTFGPMLGVSRVYGRAVAGGLLLFTADATATLCYGRDHAQDGMPRYDWTDQGDGIQVGRLKPEGVPSA